MIRPDEILKLQRTRHTADQVTEDVMIPSPARLKRRALELTACVGRLARCRSGLPVELVADVLIASVGTANVLRQDLSMADLRSDDARDPFLTLSDAVGRLADAGEKIDHLEDFSAQAREANLDIARWAVSAAAGTGVAVARFAGDRMEASIDLTAAPAL